MKKENVTYRWTFEEEDGIEVVCDKEEIIRISEDVVIRIDTDTGMNVEKVACTSKGELVYIEELLHINIDEKVGKLFDIEEIPNLSAIGLLTKLANLTLGREG